MNNLNVHNFIKESVYEMCKVLKKHLYYKWNTLSYIQRKFIINYLYAELTKDVEDDLGTIDDEDELNETFTDLVRILLSIHHRIYYVVEEETKKQVVYFNISEYFLWNRLDTTKVKEICDNIAKVCDFGELISLIVFISHPVKTWVPLNKEHAYEYMLDE